MGPTCLTLGRWQELQDRLALLFRGMSGCNDCSSIGRFSQRLSSIVRSHDETLLTTVAAVGMALA